MDTDGKAIAEALRRHVDRFKDACSRMPADDTSHLRLRLFRGMTALHAMADCVECPSRYSVSDNEWVDFVHDCGQAKTAFEEINAA